MAIAGRIEYEITVDKSGLTKGLDDAKKETNKFADALKSAGASGAKALGTAVVAGATASAGAIVKLTKDAVSSYAEFEQLKGGVETLFAETEDEIKSFEQFYGKSWEELQNSTEGFNTTADEVMANAQNAFKTAGMSANEYMEIVSNFSASLMQSVGNSWDAMEISDMAIQDMADNANKMGSSLESISTAYKGFAKGQYMLLDNLKLGYGGTKTEMERLLADAEKLSGVHYDISNLDDVYNAIHVIQTELGITGTTAKEAMDTISGSANMLKASWQNLLVGMADDTADFDMLLNNVVESASAFGKNILPRISIAIKGVVKVIGSIVPEIIKILPSIIAELLPAIVEATNALILALVENFPTLIETLLGALPAILNGIMQLFQGILDNLPMFLEAITQLILGIIKMLLSPENLKALLKAGLALFTQLILAIPDFIVALIEALPDIITSIVQFLLDPANIGMIIEAGVKLFMGLVLAIPRILGALFDAFGKLFGDLWNGVKDMFQRFAGQFGEAISGVFKGAVNGVLWFIEGFLNGPIDIINMFADGINWVLGGLTAGQVQIGKLNRIQLPRLASGGIVPSQLGGQLILAGEGGQDEWVVPESKMADMIQQINEKGGTGGGITINIQGVFATSESEQRAVAEQIYEQLQEINKARMGAYL